MIDPDGVEWLPVHDAARTARIRPSVIYTWVARHTIRFHHIKVPGTPGKPRVYVHMPDVLTAEHAWRDRATHPRTRRLPSSETG